MIDKASAAAAKTRVFISYARADMVFADRLAAALEAHGYEVLIDRRNLPTLEEWRRELLVLIRKADTIVFIVSPRSIASPVCQWEVAQMAALDKRLAPVVLERVLKDRIPAAITKINYLFFDAPSDFETQVGALARALRTDIAWWHEHTRVVELAGRWNRDGRPEGQLLRSGAITAAQAWASRRPDNAQIPEIVFQFLDASLKKEEHDREEIDKRERRISEQIQRFLGVEAGYARETHRYVRAMRFALAGEPLKDELERDVMPEPSRRAQIAAAAHAAPTIVWLSGHGAIITSAAFSSDGTRVVTASEDGTARVWDVGSGNELASLPHDASVKSAAFNADCSKVVTASADKMARVWDLASRGVVACLCHDDSVDHATFSPDGARLLTGTKAGALLWDAAGRKVLARLDHDGMVPRPSFSADATKVVTASWKGTLRVWDAASGGRLASFRHDKGIATAAFSADGTRVVTASWDQTARVWDVASGAEVACFRHDDELNSAAFSPDGAQVVTASRDRTARIWDVTTAAGLATLSHDQVVSGAAFSPDGERLVTASRDYTVRLWDARTRRELARFAHDDRENLVCVWEPEASVFVTDRDWLMTAAFSADGARVVTTSWDKVARVWDATIGTEIARSGRDQYDELVREPAYNARLKVRVLEDNTVVVSDAVTGVELARIRHDAAVTSSDVSADGARVVTASRDKTAKVWDSTTGTEVLLTLDDEVWDAAISRDGTRVVTASADGNARVWNATTGVGLAVLAHEPDPGFFLGVRCASFSRDGKRVVTASGGTARVWDAESGGELKTPSRLRHDGEIAAAQFSPDAVRVVTGSMDRTARVWDVASGAEIARFHHDDQVYRAAFGPDGDCVVTTSGKRARVWDVTWAAKLTGERLVRAVARERLKGCERLTEEELRILRPILGAVDPDVTSRWLAPSPEDAEIEAILAQWRRHREMALALATNDRAGRAEEVAAAAWSTGAWL
jgi:WD40 repeat protein